MHSRLISSLADSLSCFLFFPLSLVSHFLSVAAAKNVLKNATASYLCVYLKGVGDVGGGPKALFQVESNSFHTLQYQFHAQFIYSLGTIIVNYIPDPLYIFLPYNTVGVLVPIPYKV